jgi:hypothetical protein
MAAELPYRVWYPVSEMAQLRGCSEVMIRRMVRNGQRTRPTEPFIPADCVDHNGSIAFTNEPGPNVSPMTPNAELTDEQIARVVRQTFLEMGLLAERRNVA